MNNDLEYTWKHLDDERKHIFYNTACILNEVCIGNLSMYHALKIIDTLYYTDEYIRNKYCHVCARHDNDKNLDMKKLAIEVMLCH